MASNLTNENNNNYNPYWVVLLLIVIWFALFIYRLKQTL